MDTSTQSPARLPLGLLNLALLVGIGIGIGGHAFMTTLTTSSTSSPKATSLSTRTSTSLSTNDAITKITPKNVVRYSLANSLTAKNNIDLQFELPEGYGAVMDQEGEGELSITYYIGKLVPEYGNNVLQSTTSIPTYVRIVPSAESKKMTLADWQSAGLTLDSNAQKMADIAIAGTTASRYIVGGFGEYQLIQFIKDGNFYEIRNETGDNEAAVAKIIETITFK